MQKKSAQTHARPYQGYWIPMQNNQKEAIKTIEIIRKTQGGLNNFEHNCTIISFQFVIGQTMSKIGTITFAERVLCMNVEVWPQVSIENCIFKMAALKIKWISHASFCHSWIPWKLSFRYNLFHEKKDSNRCSDTTTTESIHTQEESRVCFHLWC